MFGMNGKIICNGTWQTPGRRLHYLPVVNLLPQIQLSNPVVQDGFWSAWLPLQCLAPVWVSPTGSLCGGGEHTCTGHLTHLNRPASYGISLSTPPHTSCTCIVPFPKSAATLLPATSDSPRLQLEVGQVTSYTEWGFSQFYSVCRKMVGQDLYVGHNKVFPKSWHTHHSHFLTSITSNLCISNSTVK